MVQLLDHPHIMKMHEVFLWNNKNCIVMDFMKGGDLLEYILKNGKLSIDASKKFLSQIISAVQYLHGMNIVHRDLKLDNILIGEEGNIKICDFGFARYFDCDGLETVCGSSHYMAPEIVGKFKYQGSKTDVWSIGVILFAMVTGSFPWPNQDSKNGLKSDIVSYNISWDPVNTLNDTQLTDILEKILTKPENRLTISEVADHPFLKGYKLPTYLPQFNPVLDINFLVIDKLVSLGYNSRKICHELYHCTTSENHIIASTELTLYMSYLKRITPEKKTAPSGRIMLSAVDRAKSNETISEKTLVSGYSQQFSSVIEISAVNVFSKKYTKDPVDVIMAVYDSKKNEIKSLYYEFLMCDKDPLYSLEKSSKKSENVKTYGKSSSDTNFFRKFFHKKH